MNKNFKIIGYDTGFFQGCLLNPEYTHDRYVSTQIYGDIRSFDLNILKNIDVVICLAAISNDPIGNIYEKQTIDINATSTVNLAKAAKNAGIKKFIYASSCSVYGAMDEGSKKETSQPPNRLL